MVDTVHPPSPASVFERPAGEVVVAELHPARRPSSGWRSSPGR